MHGQVTRAIWTGLLGGLLLAGCSSGGKANVDAPPIDVRPDAGPQADAPSTQTDAPPSPQADADDTDAAGCDEDAHTEDWCIKNWPDNVGGGTTVTRIQPDICKP
jgi:outer membrane murein-binding lipoprotein Lpp